MRYNNSMKTPYDNGRCFVCGPHNPAGLHLSFATPAPGGDTTAAIHFPVQYQGWENVVHGGLIATVLDEIMIKAAAAQNLVCVTGEITVKYKLPALTETPYQLCARVLENRGRLVVASAELRAAGGPILASAQGKLVRVEASPA